MKRMHFPELCGWIGTVLILAGYLLLSFHVLEVSIAYQVLNVLGATGLAIAAFAKRDRPNTTVEVLWALIAAVALLKLLVIG